MQKKCTKCGSVYDAAEEGRTSGLLGCLSSLLYAGGPLGWLLKGLYEAEKGTGTCPKCEASNSDDPVLGGDL